MPKEIKQRITLSGEKEYNQAIREAQRNLKTLKSELKAETAELGKNATEQQKAEKQAKSLKQQIAEQEKIVNTLKEALAEARKEYGDNADVVQSWEQKLNNARTTLASMKNDLDSMGDGFRKSKEQADLGTVAAKNYADSLGKIADAGSSVSTALENIFSGMVNTVRDAIADVWTDMMNLAGRANAWSDLAGFWNTDASEIQKWTHAVEGAHNSFEDLNSAVSRINMGDQKKITEVTGVSGENYEDRWKYAMAVMDAMSKMDYEERLNAAGEVFGEKRATKILDLLNDWGTITGNLSRFDAENGGVGMTNEQIAQMSELAEKVDLIKTTWRAFIDEFEATHLAKLALDLTGNAQRILDDLIRYLDTGSDEDLAKLEEDIIAFFDRIKEALVNAAGKLDEAGAKLQESDNSIVKLIGKAMQDLAKALQWLSESENIDKVIHGFEVLAAFWLVGKGASLITSIAQFAANLRVIKGFNTAGAVGSVLGGAGGTMASLGSSIASALTNVVLPVSLAAILCYPVLEKLFKGESPEEKEARENAEKAQEVVEQMTEADPDMPTPTQKEALQYLVTGKAPESYKGRMGEWRADKEAKASRSPAYTETGPQVNVDTTGPVSPVKSARMDVTEAQKAAVENFWDVWRSGEWGENDEKYDSAWESMEKAFEGNEAAFEKVDGWLDRLIEAYNSAETGNDFNPDRWTDIPSTWWTNPGGGDTGNNGVTSQDLEGIRQVPAAMQKAVQAGAAAGVSGIKVNLDGRTVGELVAPYVSTVIARGID